MTARGEDDIARLAASFNGMADNLQRQIRQLENLSRVQQRFVSDVSHELRTPLTTIRMAGDLLHDSRADFDPSVARAAELLHTELDRFEALLTDLLEISRFDAGAAAARPRGHRPAGDHRAGGRVGSDPGRPPRQRGGRPGPRWPLRRRGRPPPGRAHPAQPRRQRDRARRRAPGDHLVGHQRRPRSPSSVRDHGVGLRPGESGLVFNRFWRADPARARTTGGTGLGLAISLEDARLHEGWLQAWGEPGQGSCFRLTVPRRAGTPIDRSPLPLVPDGQQPLEPGSGARLAITPGPTGAS